MTVWVGNSSESPLPVVLPIVKVPPGTNTNPGICLPEVDDLTDDVGEDWLCDEVEDDVDVLLDEE